MDMPPQQLNAIIHLLDHVVVEIACIKKTITDGTIKHPLAYNHLSEIQAACNTMHDTLWNQREDA